MHTTPTTTSTRWHRINDASEEELTRVPGISPDHAHRIVTQRPFASWGEVRNVAGFNAELVEKLRQSGFTI